MGKRSSFSRRKSDAYLTFDQRAYPPLMRHLTRKARFLEMCAGRGDLALALMERGLECVAAIDVQPQDEWIYRSDALGATVEEIRATGATHIITNPPWTREILHLMIVLFSDALPTWLLFDADWIHTQQSAQYLPRLRKVVSVGRLRWIEGSSDDGKDNCAWYLFGPPSSQPPRIYGRTSKAASTPSARER